ncbi:MAG: methyltransferase domain-containing protein, partial [Bacteroidia bacterium]
IYYTTGSGEQLPYADASFDVLFCCDVLEHVRDLPAVITEISRVLKPGGVFCFDTINRTLLSKIAVIKIAQDIKLFSFMPPRLHVWNLFIKPRELKVLLAANQLEWKTLRGASFTGSPLELLRNLRLRKKGLLTYGQLGERLQLRESSSTAVFYMGYAVKK